MSWSLSIGRTAREEFDATVDAAQPSPAPATGSVDTEYDATYATNVAAGKAALKALAATLRGDWFTASISGHIFSTEQGNYPHDTFNVSVSACAAPEPEAPTPAEAAEAAVEAQNP